MHTTLESAKEAVSERLGPAREAVEQNVRDARRTIARGRRAAEDFVDDTTRRVRRSPLTSMAFAVSVGVLAGGMVGFALGWKAGHTTADR
jgi:ElaB/YqjD/DUF883 family membrane-anchored ribosome-binding protein